MSDIREITTTAKAPSSSGTTPYDLLFTGTDSSDIFSELTFGEGSAAPTGGMQAEIILDAISSGDVDPKTLSPELKALVKDKLIAQGVSEANVNAILGDSTSTRNVGDPLSYDMENALALGAAKEAGLDAGGPFGADLGSVLQQLQTGPVQPTSTTTTTAPDESIFRETGKIIDEAFRVLGLPSPTKVIGSPQGGTVVWGQSGGSPIIYTGTTPSGTQTGVSTGLPWLDAVINRVIQTATGQAGVPDFGEISSVVIQEAARGALGLPNSADMGQITDAVTKATQAGTQVFRAAEDTEGTQVGIDLGDYGQQTDDDQQVATTDAVDILTDGGGQPAVTDDDDIRGGVEVDGVTIRGGQPDVEVGGLTIRGGQPDVEVGGLTVGDFDRDIRTGTLNPYETETTRTGVAPPPEVVKYSAPASGGGGGGGGGGIAPQQGIRSVRGGPGDLVDIAGFYDISGTSIIPDYIDKLMEKRQQRRLRAAKGGHVKKFDGGGGVTAQDYFDATSGNQSGGGGIGNFFTENAPLLFGGLAGGLLGLGGGGGSREPMGYQGGIPDYTATREVVPGAFSDTDRRPGSSGRRYFTDVQFERGADDAVMGGDYLANLNQQYADQQAAREAERDQLAQGLGSFYQQQYDTRQAQQAAAAQAEQDYYREAAAAQRAYEQSLAQPATTAQTAAATTPSTNFTTNLTVDEGPAIGPEQTRYDITTIPADEDYSQSDVDYVVDAIFAGDANIQQAADRFLGGDVGETIEAMMIAGDVSPEQISPLVDVGTITVDGQRMTSGDPTIDMMINLIESGTTTLEQAASIYGIPANEAQSVYDSVINNLQPVQTAAQGGMMQGKGYYLGGPTDGMADQIPATIDGRQPAALSDGEFVIPADVVSHLGNGNSEAGAQNLYSMMERVRKDRTGNPNQGRQIDPNKYLA